MPAETHSKRMSGDEYRESLRRYKPLVYVDGQLIDTVADAPALRPGINALAVSYDFALDAAKAPLMTAIQSASGKTVNRMLHINESAGDLLNKLEAVRRCVRRPAARSVIWRTMHSMALPRRSHASMTRLAAASTAAALPPICSMYRTPT